MRPSRLGFLTAAGLAFVVDITLIATLGDEPRLGAIVWWCVNFPSFPSLLCCGPFIPVATGDDNENLNRAAMVYMTISSCLTWGGIGYWIGRMREDHVAVVLLRKSATEPDPPEMD